MAQLLATPEARVTLLHAVEHIPEFAISYLLGEYLPEARETIQAELDTPAAKLPKVSGQVVAGHSGRTIPDWAAVNKPDLIIIASHRPGIQDQLLGSTTTHVVRHA